MANYFVLTTPYIQDSELGGEYVQGWRALVVNRQTNEIVRETGVYLQATDLQREQAQKDGQLIADALERDETSHQLHAAVDELQHTTIFQVDGIAEIYHTTCGYNLLSHSRNGACPCGEDQAMRVRTRNLDANVTTQEIYLAILKEAQR